jgi:hypothetical protein
MWEEKETPSVVKNMKPIVDYNILKLNTCYYISNVPAPLAVQPSAGPSFDEVS